MAGIAAYCVGNLHLPQAPLPWEAEPFPYPANLASPLEILVEASNGASDYGDLPSPYFAAYWSFHVIWHILSSILGFRDQF